MTTDVCFSMMDYHWPAENRVTAFDFNLVAFESWSEYINLNAKEKNDLKKLIGKYVW